MTKPIRAPEFRAFLRTVRDDAQSKLRALLEIGTAADSADVQNLRGVIAKLDEVERALSAGTLEGALHISVELGILMGFGDSLIHVVKGARRKRGRKPESQRADVAEIRRAWAESIGKKPIGIKERTSRVALIARRLGTNRTRVERAMGFRKK